MPIDQWAVEKSRRERARYGRHKAANTPLYQRLLAKKRAWGRAYYRRCHGVVKGAARPWTCPHCGRVWLKPGGKRPRPVAGEETP
jgi:hypothetical protein